ncbi:MULTISPECIES: recombinase family protein [Burkholderia]|uniref:recombinase family protein n=1 Tax=Burkholderia TaxID=32008 RepID=UPI00157A3C47|nr:MULTISPECIES: recombinase family protein [Burkholderia]MCU9952087.1 recombinase family protein [Burkholderia sp. BKH01]NTY41445.1 recombinase family protein [Burkholderia diffusa]
MIVGYARVSTDEQSLELQIDALTRAGCETIHTDQGVSGADFSRPGLDAALTTLSAGDTLMVWRLDRLGRSLSKLIDLVTHLEGRSVQFGSIMESINTNSSGGVLIFHLMAALAQFERSLISERTRAGMAAARARGKPIGRKRALDDEQRAEALKLLKQNSLIDVAARFKVHPRTLKRIVADETVTKSCLLTTCSRIEESTDD